MYTSNRTQHGNKKMPTAHFRKRLLPLAVSAILSAGVAPVYAGPEGGTVVGGAGSINQNGNTTTINQATDLMAIDWQSFNLNSDERVEFIQPDSSSISLNRILGNQGSVIQGQIDANGQVILVNTNGVIFGKDSVVNAGGLLASGLDIDPNDFMNRDFAFSALENAEGKVINSGLINAATGGSVGLLGKQVKNDGLIVANLGSVNLAAGKDAVVTFDPSGLMGIKVTKEILQSELGVDAAVINSGDINAAGGQILLSASVSGEIFTQAIKINDQARSVVVHEDGSFTLGAGADVVNTGKLDVSENAVAQQAGQIVAIGENVRSSGQILASTNNSAQTGNIELHSNTTTELLTGSVTSANALESGSAGDIKILGKNVGLLGNAKVDATGVNGGGEVLIGGDETGSNSLIRNADFIYLDQQSQIHTDASLNGNGGKLITFAKDTARIYGELTSFGGTESGNGGFIETSGLKGFEIGDVPLAVARSADGVGGTWLIDPYNIEIASGSKQTSGSGSNEAVSVPGVAPDTVVNGIADLYSNLDGTATIHDGTIEWAFGRGVNVYIKTGPSSDLATAGNITLLDGVTINFNENSNATLTLHANTNINLNGSVVDGNGSNQGGNLNLLLRAGGAITQGTNSVLNVDGTTTIDAAGQDVALNGANDFENLAITAARDVGITDTNGINLGTSTLSGNLVLTANGALTDSGAIIFSTNNAEATFSVGGANNITLNSTSNDFKKIIITSANDVQIIDDNEIDIGASTISGNFNVTAEGITDSGAITVSGANKTTTLTATGFDIELDSANNFTTLSIAARDATIVDSNAIELGASTLSGNFNLSAGGAITDSGVISVASGITTLTAQDGLGDGLVISLDAANNFNQVNVVNADNVILNDTNAIVLGGFNIGTSATLTLTAGGNITDVGNLSLGNTILTTTGNITLDNDNNFRNSITILNAQNVTLKDINSLTLGTSGQNNLILTGNLDVTANGAVNIFAANNLNIAKIDSGLNTNLITITGSDNANNFTFNQNASWTGALTINGAGENDQFIFSSGLTANGDLTVNGGAGADIFSISTALSNLMLNGDAGTDTFNMIATGITATIDGGTESDTITGPNAPNTWEINTTTNSTLGSVSFTGIENVTGGTGIDTFNINENYTGTLSGNDGDDIFNVKSIFAGTINGDGDSGGAGNRDTVDFSTYVGTVSVTTNQFNTIETLIGNSTASTLTGGTSSTTWGNLSSTLGVLSGNVNGITFSGFTQLVGGIGSDIFNLTTNGTYNIDAGTGDEDTIDISGVSTAQTITLGSSAFGITNVERFVGNALSTLLGPDTPNNVWTINGSNSGTLGAYSFSNFGTIQGGILNDTFNFTGSGTLNGNTLVGGTGTDTVSFLSSTLSTQFNWSATSLDGVLGIDLVLRNNSNAVLGNFNGVEIVNAGNQSNQVNSLSIADNQARTWSITSSNTTDGIDALDGNLRLTASPVVDLVFTNMDSLTGDAAVDTFSFAANSTLNGTLNGGSNTTDELQLTSASALTINLEGISFGGLTLSGVEIFQGPAGFVNTLIGYATDSTWSVTSNGVGTVTTSGKQASFSNFSILQGNNNANDIVTVGAGGAISAFNGNGGSDTLNLSNAANSLSLVVVDNIPASLVAGNIYIANLETLNLNTAASVSNNLISEVNGNSTWTINNANAGSFLNNSKTVNFTGVSNLFGGTGDDVFSFTTAGSLAGYISGGNQNSQDRMDLSSLSAVDITLGSGAYTGIETIIGNNTNSTLRSVSGTNTWQITNNNQGSVNNDILGAVNFEGFNRLLGSTGVDNFTFNNNVRITGVVDGNTGAGVIDTVNLSAVSSDINLVLVSDVSASVVSASSTYFVANMETVTLNDDSSRRNTLTSNLSGESIWTVAGARNGSFVNASETTIFTGVTHLMGGAENDTFNFSVVPSASFTVNGGSNGNDTVNVSSINNYTLTVGTTGFQNIDNYIGNLTNTLAVQSAANWTITGTNAGTLNSTITFQGFNRLLGGSGNDTFNSTAIGSNLNIVLAPDMTSATPSGSNYYLANMETLTLNTATTNTITSNLSGETTWSVTGNTGNIVNSGRTVNFTAASNLVGGAGNDIFTFTSAPATGVIVNGGSDGNDTVNISALNNYTLTVGATGFQNIDNYIGSLTNTLAAQTGSTWTITGTNTGTLNNTITFQGFNRLQGGLGGDIFNSTQIDSDLNIVLAPDVTSTTLTGGDYYLAGMETLTLNNSGSRRNTLTSNLLGNTTWLVNGGNMGSVTNGSVVTNFSGVSNLVGGAGNDSFGFTAAGDLTGTLDGGTQAVDGRDTVDLSLLTAVNITVGQTADYFNIEGYKGNGTNSTFRIQNGENTWNITASNTGTLANTTFGTISFEGFNYLYGGTDADNFIFGASGALSNNGFIDGGTGTAIDTVNFAALASVDIQISSTNGYNNIEQYVGNNSNSRLRIASGTNTWTLNTVNGGSLNSILFSGFNNLDGGDESDIFQINSGGGISGTINGNDGGDIIFLQSGAVTGAINGNLGDDVFNVASGSVSGLLSGDDGDDSLILTLGSSLAANGNARFNGGTSTDGDQILITGSNITEAAYSPAGADGYSQLVYSNATNNYQLNFLVGNNANVNDNVVAQTLRINGSSAADSILMQNAFFNVNSSLNVNYTTKTNLLLSESNLGSNDTLVIAGNVDFSGGSVTVEAASVASNNNSAVLRARDLILDSVAAVGSATQRFNISAENLSLRDISSSIYLNEENAVNIAELKTFSAVDLLAEGSINSTAVLSAQGPVIMASQSNNVSLENQQNTFTGAMIVNAAGNITLANSVATNITSLDAGGNLGLSSGGAVTATGIVTVDGNTTLAVNGNASFLNANNDFNDFFIDNATDISVTDIDGLVLRTVNMQGALTTNSQTLDVMNGTVKIGSGVLNVLGATAANLNSEITATSGLTVNATGLTVNSGITADSLVLNGQTGNVIINSSITAAKDLGVSGQFIDVNNTVRGNAVVLSANGDLDVGAAVTATAGLELKSVSGDLRVTGNMTAASLVASANDLLQVGGGGVLDVQGNIDLDSVAGDIEQSGRINSAGGIITLDTVNNINMMSGAEINNTLGEVRLTAGDNINVQRVNAGTGLIVVKATSGEIVDTNDTVVNFIGNRLEITANAGIGRNQNSVIGEHYLEMSVNEIALGNGGGDVAIVNDKALQIDQLYNNGNVSVKTVLGDIIFNNDNDRTFDIAQADANLSNGLVNANYEIGNLIVLAEAGNIRATGRPRSNAPDIVALNAQLVAPQGGVGVGRPLVVYVKNSLDIVAVTSYKPFWAFDTPPVNYTNSSLEIDLLGLIGASGEEMVEVEEVTEIDPAVFANVRNYFFDDVSIRLPRDQLYDDDQEEKRKNQVSFTNY